MPCFPTPVFSCRAGLLLTTTLALCATPARFAVGQDAATTPTATASDPSLDAAWRAASAKYDGARGKLLKIVDTTIANGPFRADWQSLSTYQVPDWYRDAKFGIFIHWGVYSVPAFGSEWYPRLMYEEGSPENRHQLAAHGPLTQFGYKDFIPMFRAEHFDPDAWAALFKASGARYVVPVFEHHDGFAMYASGLSDWTAVNMGPHRDLMGDLAQAVRTQGLHLGASSHRIEHDWFLEYGRREPSDVNDPQYAGFYGPAHTRRGSDDNGATLLADWTYLSPDFMEDWLARDAEIVEKYHPEVMYFDWWIGQPALRPYLDRFAAYYYDESIKHGGIPGVLNYKIDAMETGSGVLDIERGQLAGIRALPWQTDTSLSNKSWGYVENDTYKASPFLIRQLADIVSKNGNLLLNIGPRADGTIPDEAQQVLREIGAWLGVNGEAIYGTRPWRVFGEGPTEVKPGQFHDTDTENYTTEDFRFTTKGSTLYAIEMVPATTGKIVVHALASGVPGAAQVRSVALLGSTARLTYTQKPDGLHVNLPAQTGPYAQVFRIEFR